MTKAELIKSLHAAAAARRLYHRDKSDTIIYIGKAKRLKTRVSQYFREGVPHDAKVTQMIAHAFSFDGHRLPVGVRGAGAGGQPDQGPHPQIQHPAQG